MIIVELEGHGHSECAAPPWHGRIEDSGQTGPAQIETGDSVRVAAGAESDGPWPTGRQAGCCDSRRRRL